MGRHSSPDQGHFYRSFFGWLGLWAMIAVATAVAVWFTVSAIGGPDARTSLATDAASEDEEPPVSDPAPTVSGARIANDTASTPTPSPRPARKDRRDKAKLITEGVTIQVLDGTANAAAPQAVADKLSGLGYSVVAIEASSRLYSDTTVFWSTDASRDAAEALAQRFGWVAEQKPANLSASVSLHVVVGADES
ncbi:MAG: LytR C-terminal domain-containing protein [Actinobacteria bacterium]|nr:LytR C-terminal domain-containing protein [Actinomycetota bacterium]